MASSPPYSQSYGTSVSPPYPSHTSLPSKKRSSEMPPGASKRRKPSLLSATSTHSSHPLRQTSFPPDARDLDRAYSADARSPSVEATSMVSGHAKASKKRGRKPKGPGGDDGGSMAGGRASTAVSMVSGRAARGGTRGASPEEDEDEGGMDMDVATVARTNEEKEKEKYYRSLLVGALDPDQYARYERWRSSKLADSVVRRVSPFISVGQVCASAKFDAYVLTTTPRLQLVNQTLSQSVPSNVVIAVKSVSKVFAGELIERARKIQTQWLAASHESPTEDPLAAHNNPNKPVDADKDVQLWNANQAEARRGPLTPEHLREALRRYKCERGGGLVGLMGLDRGQHATGTERFGLKARGRKLLG